MRRVINRRVEQSAARVAHNHEVAGSSPAPATNSASARLNAEYAGEPEFGKSPPSNPATVDPVAGIFLPWVEARL
jgi:hypothetical protein